MWHILVKGGWMMLPLAVCSLVSVTIIIERFLFFGRIRQARRAEEVLALVRKQRTREALAVSDEARTGGPVGLFQLLAMWVDVYPAIPRKLPSLTSKNRGIKII